MAIRISTELVKRLTERGLIPPHCGRVELLIPPDGAMVLRYEVFVTDAHLDILGSAFIEMAADTRQANSAVVA